MREIKDRLSSWRRLATYPKEADHRRSALLLKLCERQDKGHFVFIYSAKLTLTYPVVIVEVVEIGNDYGTMLDVFPVGQRIIQDCPFA